MNTFLTCPADCDDALDFGAIDVNQDCTAYQQKYSQVCDLIIQPDAANAPLDWTGAPTVSAVAGEVDNTNTDGTKSKWLVGEGGVPVPEKITDEYPKRKSKTSFRTYTLVFNVKNLSDDQYAFLQQVQCGNTDFKIWYANVGGHIFGGTTGIDIASIDADLPLDESRDGKEVGTITITWDADGDPTRGDAPASYVV